MIAAGFGLSRSASTETLLALYGAVLAAAGRPAAGCLATLPGRAALPAFLALAARLGLPVREVAAQELEAMAGQVVTRSPRILALHGVGSVAEAAALAAAGPGARLVVARIDAGNATCALAEGGS